MGRKQQRSGFQLTVWVPDEWRETVLPFIPPGERSDIIRQAVLDAVNARRGKESKTQSDS